MAILSEVDLLRRVPLFSGLSEEAARVIAQSVTKRRVSRNELILKQGARSAALVIFLNGRARVIRSDDAGREVTLALLGAGDHVGEMSLLDDGIHSASVRADTKADVLVIRRADLAGLLPAQDTLAHAVMRGLVSRLRAADSGIQSLALLDVRGRVIEKLKSLAVTVDGAQLIRARVCRQDLAKLVGASREMVSRVMCQLEADGFIRTRDDGATQLFEQPEPAAAR